MEDKINAKDENLEKEFDLNTLCKRLHRLYPEIDPNFLRQIISNFNYKSSDIQACLDEATEVNSFPSHKKTQEFERQCLIQLQHTQADFQLWACPECGGWQIVSEKDAPSVIICKGIISCGEFCFKCKLPNHLPFACRNSEVVLKAELGTEFFSESIGAI